MLGLDAVGFWNIALAVNDFYNYDVITNIERVTPENVTFPAITICADTNSFKIKYFINGTFYSIVDAEKYEKSQFKFIDFIFGSSSNWKNTNDYLDYFKIPENSLDCIRFNRYISL